MMRLLKTACTCASFTALIVTASCSSSQQASYSWRGKKPKFIDSLTLGGNGSNQLSTSSSENTYCFEKTSEPYTYGKTNSAAETQRARQYDPAISNILQIKYADLLAVVPAAITNIPLYGFIDEWYGVRYRFGGNDKTGIDCSAFVQRLYEEVFATNILRTAVEQFSLCKMADEACDLKEGDLVFFYSFTYGRKGKGRNRKTYITGKRISHVGVYLANDRFVHASTSQGVMISSLKENYWSGKFAGAGQVPRG
jgi:lipoprotein Spr